MASYKCATILVIAICLCFFHLSSSLDTIIKGKKECPQQIHNTTVDLRRVLKGGRKFSGGARSFSGGSYGYSSERGGYSSSSTAVAAASASASSNSHHHSNNSSVICMRSNFLAISFLAVVLSSFFFEGASDGGVCQH